MTGSLVLDLLISLAGVGVLIAVSWALGGWRSAPADEAAARERIAFDEPDFEPGDWLVGADGASAAALSADGGEAVYVFAVGDGLATRRVRTGAVPVSAEGETVVVALRDPSKWRLRLAAGDEAAAAAWAGRLAGQGPAPKTAPKTASGPVSGG